jgi:hypothetical protein
MDISTIVKEESSNIKDLTLGEYFKFVSEPCSTNNSKLEKTSDNILILEKLKKIQTNFNKNKEIITKEQNKLNCYIDNSNSAMNDVNDVNNCLIVSNINKKYYNNIEKMFDTSDIINLINEKRTKIAELYKNQNYETSIGFEISDSKKIHIDDNKDIKDVASQFITDNLLSNSEIFNIVKIITDMCRTAINAYINQFNVSNASDASNASNRYNLGPTDIKIIFKGGMALTTLLNSVLNTANPIYKDHIINNFTDILQRSDLDFSILINPKHIANIEIYNKIYLDMQYMSTYILDRVRKIILNSENAYIQYYQHDQTTRKEVLKKLLDKLNEIKFSSESVYKDFDLSNNFRFITVVFGEDFYGNDELINNEELINDYRTRNVIRDSDYNGSSRKDIYIRMLNDDSNIKIISHLSLLNKIKPELETKYQISKRPYLTPFFISYNNNIKFGTIGTQKFSLVRIKINFKAYYTIKRNEKEYIGAINTPGEFIDISIPYHIGDSTEQFVWDDLKEYTMTFREDPNTIIFDSYSIKQYFEDINRILFNVNIYPWQNIKYDKRLKRLMLLGYIDILSRVNHKLNFINNKQSLMKLFSDLVSILKSINITPTDDISAKFEEIRNKFGKISAKFEEIKKFDEKMILIIFFNKLVDFISKFTNPTNPTNLANQTEFIEFIKNIIGEINKLSELTKTLHELKNNSSIKDISDTKPIIILDPVINLLGGSHSKTKYYLKKNHI